MIEVASTMDAVRLSFLRVVLERAGVDYVIFDAAAGSTWPGAFPSRVMAPAEQAWLARSAIKSADVELAQHPA